MEENKTEASSPEAPCFQGGGQECGCNGGEASAACNCEPAPSKHSWIKNLLAVVILLAAVGVGAYSVFADKPAAQRSPAAAAANPTPPVTANPSAVPSPSAPAPACCSGAAAPAAAPLPGSCCGAAQPAAAPQPGSCCGAAQPVGIGSEPSCGAPSKGCCGQ